jgi:hypothetical protein
MNYYLLNYIINLRCYFVNNFCVKIIGIKYNNNNIFYLNIFYQYFLKIIPFILLKYIFNILNYEIFYLIDNIYYTSKITDNHILPIIFSIQLKNITYSKDIKSILKFYNPSISIDFFINYNKFYNYDYFAIEYFKNNKKMETTIDLSNCIHLKIYNLFI